jgi:hypothetical protein
MLDSHPQLTVANDTHFIPRALEKSAPPAIQDILREGDVPLTPELVDAVRCYHRFPRLGVDDQAVGRAVQGATTYRELVTRLYDELASLRQKPLAGEKTPGYVRCLPLLHRLFPWARTIHIIRDGRDTALSLMDWATESKGPGRLDLWRQEPLGLAALWWRWQVKSGIDAAPSLAPGRHLQVRYEQLIARPEEELTRIAAFLQIPFAHEMLAYHAGKRRQGPSLSAKSAWLPPTSGLRVWRTQMPPDDLQLFEALAGDLLAKVGYLPRCRKDLARRGRTGGILSRVVEQAPERPVILFRYRFGCHDSGIGGGLHALSG